MCESQKILDKPVSSAKFSRNKTTFSSASVKVKAEGALSHLGEVQHMIAGILRENKFRSNLALFFVPLITPQTIAATAGATEDKTNKLPKYSKSFFTEQILENRLTIKQISTYLIISVRFVWRWFGVHSHSSMPSVLCWRRRVEDYFIAIRHDWKLKGFV